ncbi:MAG: hypothetical protein LBK56_09565 [Gracilibacteraceae bacterium]|jgi:hypothetical protein|nr:hypothetical protein [Gracilibacteraceae bacterium]
MKYCKNCDTYNSDRAVKCTDCGAELKDPPIRMGEKHETASGSRRELSGAAPAAEKKPTPAPVTEKKAAAAPAPEKPAVKPETAKPVVPAAEKPANTSAVEKPVIAPAEKKPAAAPVTEKPAVKPAEKATVKPETEKPVALAAEKPTAAPRERDLKIGERISLPSLSPRINVAMLTKDAYVACFGLDQDNKLPPEPQVLAVTPSFILELPRQPQLFNGVVVAVYVGGLSTLDLKQICLYISDAGGDTLKFSLADHGGSSPMGRTLQGLAIINLCEIYYHAQRSEWRLRIIAGSKRNWTDFLANYSEDNERRKSLRLAIQSRKRELEEKVE